MINFFTKLRNMLNAIAYAEAGDLDAVKQILQTRYSNAQVSENKMSASVSGGQSALPAI